MGLSQAEREILPQDTQGARRLYRNDRGQQLFCSVILSGRDVTSIHRPELCLPAQGWKIHSQFVEEVQIPSAHKGRLKLMRLNAETEQGREQGRPTKFRAVFAYWFVGKERVTPHHMERVILTTKDRVLHNTNHRWSYILLHAMVDTKNQTSLERAEDNTMEMMAGFVRDVYPELMLN